MNTTPRPWNTNSPDETLILGPDRQVIATTLQDEDDYQADYDTRYADAELIVKAVNTYTALPGAILKLPRRVEKISGQSFSYVKLEDVLAILDAPSSDAVVTEAVREAEPVGDSERSGPSFRARNPSTPVRR